MTEHPLPPPPPPAPAPLTTGPGSRAALLTGWFALQGGTSIALILAWRFGFSTHPEILGTCGGFLAIHVVLLALYRYSEHPLARGALQQFSHRLVHSGVGFYGLVTLARFLQLEVDDILADLNGEWSLSIGGFIREWVIGFSIDSLRNSIEAFQWPWKLLLRAGWPWTIGALACCWLPYALAGRLFPDLKQLLEAESGNKTETSDGPANR